MIRSCLLASAALLMLSSAAVAAPAEGPARTFQPRDLFGLEQALDPQIRRTAPWSPMSARRKTS